MMKASMYTSEQDRLGNYQAVKPSHLPRWRPWCLTKLMLGALIVVAFALIGLVEYASRTLPDRSGGGLLGKLHGQKERRELTTVTQTQLKTTGTGPQVETLVVIESRSSAFSCPSGLACSAAPNAWLPIGTLTLGPSQQTSVASVIVSPNPSNWLKTRSITYTPLPPPGAPNPTHWLPTGSITYTPLPPGAPNPTHWLQTGSTTHTAKPTPGPSSTGVVIFTVGDYFTGAFLPTIVAMLFAIPWGIIDITCKELEAFYQLSLPAGASASNSLCLDISNSSPFTAPFVALIRSHWVVLVTSALYSAALLLAPFASESVFISVAGACTSLDPGINCPGTLSVSKPFVRAVEALLGAMAVLALILVYTLHNRSRVLYADPRSIAGLATLFQQSEIITDFRNLDPSASKKEIAKTLGIQRYGLHHYRNNDGSTTFGLVRLRNSRSYHETGFPYHGSHFVPENVFDPEFSATQPPPSRAAGRRICVRKVSLFIFAAVLAGLLSVIIYYHILGVNNAFERFMDSQSFGIRFLFTAIGVITKTIWILLFREIHILEPYASLAASGASQNHSIFLAPKAHPLLALSPSLLHGHFLSFLTAFCAFLSDPLTVVLPNIPFSHATTLVGYTVSTYLSIAILSAMIITLTISFFQPLKPKMPHKPTTIMAVLVMICGSKMLESFQDLSTVQGNERDRRVRGIGGSYGYGVVKGLDGVARLGVDFDEFVDRGR